MATTSLDLRQRIINAYDREEGTRADLAQRFSVSLGLVAKLLHQRRRTGDIAPRHCFSGRKPKLVAEHRRQLRTVLAKKPDATLQELRATLNLDCTIQAIHYVLAAMGLTYKKRRSGRVNKTVRTSPARGGLGGGGRAVSTRRSSSF
jgi:transposase